MTQPFSKPRTIDHLVLPVADINVARARYEAMGFVVAPDGRHPFGTENCCIFFEDGTFLEPIGIAQRETCEATALAGNTFTANDLKYRFRRGVEGFSHLVLKTDDASADHKFYRKHAMSGGRPVRFSRRFETPTGEKGRVAFKLSFAADSRSPDTDFFSCQVINPPQVDRTALMAHDNGVAGLREVIACEVNPTDFQYFFQALLNQREMDVDSFAMSFDTSNTKVTVMTPDGLHAYYGMEESDAERGMRFVAAIMAVTDLDSLTKRLAEQGIAATMVHNRLIVPPAPGQGTTLMFEEA